MGWNWFDDKRKRIDTIVAICNTLIALFGLIIVIFQLANTNDNLQSIDGNLEIISSDIVEANEIYGELVKANKVISNELVLESNISTNEKARIFHNGSGICIGNC